MSDPVSPLLFCILCESESNSPNNFEQFRTIWFPFLFEMQIEDKTFNCATSRQRNCVVFAGGAFYSCFVFSSDSFEGRPPGGWVVGVLGAPSSTHFPLFPLEVICQIGFDLCALWLNWGHILPLLRRCILFDLRISGSSTLHDCS